MFHPRIGRTTMTPEIKAQVAEALERGETVRLGRWTVRRLSTTGRCEITKHAEESRNGPLVEPVSIGCACPESQAADSAVTYWLGDW